MALAARALVWAAFVVLFAMPSVAAAQGLRQPTVDIRDDADKNVTGATVVLDGQDKGKAPVAFAAVPGRHLVEVTRDGFQSYALWIELGVDRVLSPTLAPVAATDTATGMREGVAAPPPAMPGKAPRIIASIGLAMPVYIWAEPTGMSPGVTTTPDQKQSLAQSIAVGYVVNPRVNVFLSALFFETVHTNMGTTGFAFGGVAAFASLRLWRGLSLGAGPMVFYREFLKSQNDLGALFVLAYPIKLPDQFALTFVVNSPQAWLNRPVIAITPGVSLSRRF